MPRRSNKTKYFQQKRRSQKQGENGSQEEHHQEAAGSSSEHHTPPVKVVITANCRMEPENIIVTMASPLTPKARFPSYFKMDIIGIQFGGVLSTGSSGTVLSNRVYDKIVSKTEGNSQYKLEKTPGIEVSDLFGNEIKLLGALCVPCTIFSHCGTWSTTELVRFLVVEGGGVDCVFGAGDISADLHGMIFQKFTYESQSKKSEAKKEFNVETVAPSKKVIKITAMAVDDKWGSLIKMEVMGVPFNAVLSTGSNGTVLSARVYKQIINKLKGTPYRLENAPGIEVEGMKVLGALHVPCTFISACGTNSIIEQIEFIVVDGCACDCVVGMPEVVSCKMSIDLCRNLIVFKNHNPPVPIFMVDEDDSDDSMKEENSSSKCCASPDQIVTITTVPAGKVHSIFRMEIMGVSFEAVLSMESNGTVLSSKVYNQIVSRCKDGCKLEMVEGIQVHNVAGREMELLGVLRVPCKFISACGTNTVTELVTFLVLNWDEVDCVFGTPEISSCEMAIIIHRNLLVFMNHRPAIPIAMVGAKEDPNVALENVMQVSFGIEWHLPPKQIVRVMITSSTKALPYMLKMNILDVPLQVALSSRSTGTILSSRIYEKISSKLKNLPYRLDETSNVQVQDIDNRDMKLLGTLSIPCKFIDACRINSITKTIQFLVVEDIAVDGVFGAPEIHSSNILLKFEKEDGLLVFENHDPPVEIGAVKK